MSRGSEIIMKKFLTGSRKARILADMRPLNELLREWREMPKLSPAEAGRQCEMSRQQWSELESGATTDPRSSTLRKLVRGTGIPIERLVEAASFASAQTGPRPEPDPADSESAWDRPQAKLKQPSGATS